jgi:RNA polymerase sigma-70 factor (ECF subfamily)
VPEELEARRRRGGEDRFLCLVPADLDDRLAADLRAWLRDHGVRPVVDLRRRERRRGGDRRRPAARGAPRPERRRIHALDGRRVAQRRAPVTAARRPPGLPATARAQARRCTFVERHPPAPRDVEDAEALRLIIRLQAGEAQALSQIYERYLARVYGYLRVALRDEHEAQDVAHEVFAALLRALPHFRVSQVPFRVWLFRVVRNHAVNHVRRGRPVEPMDPEQVTRRLEREPASQEAAAHPLAELDDAGLLRLIEWLPLVQRQVIVLRFVMGFRTAEVAEILGRSPNAISQLQRRALAILRERLIATGQAPRGARDTGDLTLPMRRRLRDALVTRTRRLALSSY